jgi:hypothetical protein
MHLSDEDLITLLKKTFPELNQKDKKVSIEKLKKT